MPGRRISSPVTATGDWPQSVAWALGTAKWVRWSRRFPVAESSSRASSSASTRWGSAPARRSAVAARSARWRASST